MLHNLTGDPRARQPSCNALADGTQLIHTEDPSLYSTWSWSTLACTGPVEALPQAPIINAQWDTTSPSRQAKVRVMISKRRVLSTILLDTSKTDSVLQRKAYLVALLVRVSHAGPMIMNSHYFSYSTVWTHVLYAHPLRITPRRSGPISK